MIVFVVVADDVGESEMEEEGGITADNYYRLLRVDLDWTVIHLSNNKLHDLRTILFKVSSLKIGYLLE